MKYNQKKLNTLVIEDTKYFSKFVRGFIASLNRQNDDFELIEKFEKLNLSKITNIIFDLFNLEANASNILKKLYSELEEDINSEEMYPKKVEMESVVIKIMDDLIYRSRFSLTMGDVNYQNLFKACSVEFDYDHSSLVERLIEYMEVSSRLLGIKLFVFVNLDSFLSVEELNELKKYLCYNEIKVLALQNNISRRVDSDENLRIIDNDFCEI